MFEALEEENRSHWTLQRIGRWAVLFVLTALIFGGLYLGIHFLS